MIEVQPTGNVFSLSPVIFHLYDTNNALTDFEYVLDVFIWSGHKTTDVPSTPNFTLTKLPNADGYATFDISYLVRASLVPEEPNDYLFGASGIVDTADNHTKWIYAKASYWTDGATRTASESSTTRIALRGWTPYSEGVNSDHQNENTFALAVTGQHVPTNVPFSFSINTTAVRFVDVTLSNGQSVTYNTASVDDDLNDQKIQTVVLGADVTNDPSCYFRHRVEADSGTVENAFEVCVENYLQPVPYTDVTTKNTAGDVQKTWRMHFAIEPKYTQYFLAFLNRYGCWDYLPLTLNDIEAIAGKRSEYDNEYLTTSDASVTYDTTKPTARVFNAGGRKNIRVNTGYQPEGIFEYLQDIAMSERHTLVSASTLQPLKLSETNFTKKTVVTDNLINYTLSFEFGSDVANHVTI